jgi:hypothetical protein
VGKGKPRWRNKNKTQRSVFGLFCRSVGPGGTSLDFYRTGPDEITAVWENENCPYDHDDASIDDVTRASSNGHNVSTFSRKALLEALGVSE